MDLPDIRDDQAIAHYLLPEMFPKGTSAAGARSIQVPPRKFLRWINGDPIKSHFLPLLHGLEGYTERYNALKGKKRQAVDPDVTEAVTRLHRALGPGNLKLTVFEIESLCELYGPENLVAALERTKENGRAAIAASLDSEDAKEIG